MSAQDVKPSMTFLLSFLIYLIYYFSFIDSTFDNRSVALCHDFNMKTFPFLLKKPTICLAEH